MKSPRPSLWPSLLVVASLLPKLKSKPSLRMKTRSLPQPRRDASQRARWRKRPRRNSPLLHLQRGDEGRQLPRSRPRSPTRSRPSQNLLSLSEADRPKRPMIPKLPLREAENQQVKLPLNLRPSLKLRNLRLRKRRSLRPRQRVDVAGLANRTRHLDGRLGKVTHPASSDHGPLGYRTYQAFNCRYEESYCLMMKIFQS